jgi:hypothetical protein
LFYVYPLKFVFTYLIGALLLKFGLVGEAHRAAYHEEIVGMVTGADAGTLMVIYSAGYLGVALVFTLLYHHAWRLRDALELNPKEREITRASIGAQLINCFIAIVSIGLAVAGYPAAAGFCYFVLGPLHGIHGHRSGRKIAAA